MTRLSPILACLALLGGAGCGSSAEQPAAKADTFKSSAPPAGYVEEKMKARDAAKVPSSAETGKAMGSKGP